MKRNNVSRNASDRFGLMDMFLCRPKPKRWLFSKAASVLETYAMGLEKLARYFEPREVHVNERILEIPFVLQRIPVGSKVLDVGSSSSSLALQLACLGYSVTAIDVRPYPFAHPNLTFLQQDIASCNLPEQSHDYAILISTLEHMGLGAYGDSRGMSDREFLDTVAKYVRPGGHILITFPFGARFQGTWYRVYDAGTLTSLLHGYEVVEKKFARRTSLLSFDLCSESDLEGVGSESLPVNGVAMLDVLKP